MLPESITKNTLMTSCVSVYRIIPAKILLNKNEIVRMTIINEIAIGRYLISCGGILKLNLNRYASRIEEKVIIISIINIRLRGVFRFL